MNIFKLLVLFGSAAFSSLLWYFAKPNPNLNETDGLIQFRWRRQFAKIAIAPIFLCICFTVYAGFFESNRLLLTMDAIILLFIILGIPTLSVFTFWITYRCPRCGNSLELKLNLNPDRCMTCDLPLQTNIRIPKEMSPEQFARLYRKRLVISQWVLAFIVVSLVFLGIVNSREVWHPSEDVRNLLNSADAVLLVLLIITAMITCRCPKCKRLVGGLGWLFSYTGGPDPCNSESVYLKQ